MEIQLPIMLSVPPLAMAKPDKRASSRCGVLTRCRRMAGTRWGRRASRCRAVAACQKWVEMERDFQREPALRIGQRVAGNLANLR
jgi:hypothetical protein